VPRSTRHCAQCLRRRHASCKPWSRASRCSKQLGVTRAPRRWRAPPASAPCVLARQRSAGLVLTRGWLPARPGVPGRGARPAAGAQPSCAWSRQLVTVSAASRDGSGATPRVASWSSMPTLVAGAPRTVERAKLQQPRLRRPARQAGRRRSPARNADARREPPRAMLVAAAPGPRGATGESDEQERASHACRAGATYGEMASAAGKDDAARDPALKGRRSSPTSAGPVDAALAVRKATPRHHHRRQVAGPAAVMAGRLVRPYSCPSRPKRRGQGCHRRRAGARGRRGGRGDVGRAAGPTGAQGGVESIVERRAGRSDVLLRGTQPHGPARWRSPRRPAMRRPAMR
jgi:hypothetical protein